MDNLMEGKYTLELFAEERGLTRNSALNLLSKLKKQGYVKVSGGGRQKRIYTIYNTPQEEANGFYTIVNKYSPEKLIPRFKHVVKGKYTIEDAIIDGIKIGDVRTLNATKHLFRHIKNWKRLFDLAKRHQVLTKLYQLYDSAKKELKVKRMPKRYLK